MPGDIRSEYPGDFVGIRRKVDLASIDPMARKKPRRDKAVLRLERSIPNCNAYDIRSDGDAVYEGMSIFAVTFPQVDMLSGDIEKEPLAYPCRMTTKFHARDNGLSLYYTDCDLNQGGSGGFILGRPGLGKNLFVMGILIRAGESNKNGLPYSESDKNFALALGVDGDVPSMLQKK